MGIVSSRVSTLFSLLLILILRIIGSSLLILRNRPTFVRLDNTTDLEQDSHELILIPQFLVYPKVEKIVDSPWLTRHVESRTRLQFPQALIPTA